MQAMDGGKGEPTATWTASPAVGPAQTLIVDDHPMFRQAYVADHLIDVAVVDIVSPEARGVLLVRHLRAAQPRCKVRRLTQKGHRLMKGTILVVDDHTDAAELLRDLLRMRGFDATAVSSGQGCLDHLTAHPTDVVVTDVQMPGMSGIELCTTLRDRHPELLSIVITGQGDFETASAATRAGAYDLLAKPVKIDAVEVAVSRALAHLMLERESRCAGSTRPPSTICPPKCSADPGDGSSLPLPPGSMNALANLESRPASR